MVSLIFFSVFVVSAILNVYSAFKDKTLMFKITKPIIMLSLFLSVLSLKNYQFSNQLSFVYLALLFGCIGDTCLEINKIFFTILGGISFAIGHLFWIYEYFMKFDTNYTITVIIFGIVALAALFIYLNNIGILKHGVIIYFCVIYALEITTLYNLIHGCKILPFLGSTLFVISDSMIGLSALKNKSKQFLPYIMITYIAAQLLLTAGSL